MCEPCTAAGRKEERRKRVNDLRREETQLFQQCWDKPDSELAEERPLFLSFGHWFLFFAERNHGLQTFSVSLFWSDSEILLLHK